MKKHPIKSGTANFTCKHCGEPALVKKHTGYYDGRTKERHVYNMDISGIVLHKDWNYRVFLYCPHCDKRDTDWV